MAKKRIIESEVSENAALISIDTEVIPVVEVEPVAEEVKVEVEEPKKSIFGIVNASRLNVRKAASPSAPIIKIINNGEKVELKSLEQKSMFYELIDGTFVMADFITVQ